MIKFAIFTSYEQMAITCITLVHKIQQGDFTMSKAGRYLRWLNTVLGKVSGSACFKLDKQTWRRTGKQWYTEDDFSKSAHSNFVIFFQIFTFNVF